MLSLYINYNCKDIHTNKETTKKSISKPMVKSNHPQNVNILNTYNWLKKIEVKNISLDNIEKITHIDFESWRCGRIVDKEVEKLKKDLHHLIYLKDLKSLNLANTDTIDDKDIIHLKHLNKLEKLDLRQTGITDKGLEEISKIKNLVSLDLSETSITGVGLSYLIESLHN